MKKKNNSLKRTVTITIVLSIVVLYMIVSLFFSFVKPTNESYSVTRTWKEYYSLEDWNLSQHALVDIDTDGKQDMVTFTNCAFLTSVTPDRIPKENQCVEPTMSVINFADNSVTVGQKLAPSQPFLFDWFRKSYLVKTDTDVWKFYEINGLQIRVYELGNNNLFTQKNPSLLDSIDLITYQASHLGVAFIYVVLSLFIRF